MGEAFVGKSDVTVTADSRVRLNFLSRKRNLPGLLLCRALRMKGNLRLLADFGRCFPA
jgi:hypothetical protein